MRTGISNTSSISILSRENFQSGNESDLSAAQIRVDAALSSFSDQASDVGNLFAMTSGALAYRFARVGLLSTGLFKSAATVGALAVEVSAFRGVSNGVARFQGREIHEGIFDGRGWCSSFLDFAVLKGVGVVAQGQHPLLSHTLQSTAMVASHQLTYGIGLTTQPQGTLLEQLFDAEAMNLALGAGHALMGTLTGHRLSAVERSLDVIAKSRSFSRSRLFSQFRPHLEIQKPFLSMMAGEAGSERVLADDGRVFSPLLLEEPAINDFWRTHLESTGNAHQFLRSSSEASRLHRSLLSVESDLSGRRISRREFLNAVLKKLQSTQGVAGKEYKTRYALEVTVERFDSEMKAQLPAETGSVWKTRLRAALRIVGMREEAPNPVGLFGRYLARYPVENRGGLDWGERVNDAKPHKALESALELLPTNEKGDLIATHDGKSLEVRLREARELLAQEKVKLVSVWGAGRHGLALGDWVRQAASHGEMIDGHYVIPIMLGHRPDFTYELNLDGTNEKQLSGIPINEPGRLALRAAHPLQNRAYLSLSDTVMVTLPSTELKKEFTEEVIRNIDPNTQLIFAIKSVLDRGESIPGYVMESLARMGRFDLMVNAAFQSGLGFPKEMFGRLAPDAPVNLAVDAMNIEAAERAAKTLVGDRGEKAQVSPHKRTFTSLNKRVDAGVLVFKGAYGGFIKNFIAPWVGYRLVDYYVENLAHITSGMMRSKLAALQEEAVELSERIFNQFEADAIRREVTSAERILLQSTSLDHPVERNQALDWVEKVKLRLDKYRDRVTATEDLLGCTRIRDMDVFIRIMGDLLNARGLTFERRLSELTGRVRSFASSTNFAYGLLEPIYLALVKKGMLVERPKRDFTVEGINGLPNAETRWGNRPEFVQETLAWVNPLPEPRGQPELHASGLRKHAMRVVRDYIDEMEEHTHPIILSVSTLPASRQRQQAQEILTLGKEMIARLRHEKELFPPASEDILGRIGGTLIDFDRFLLDSETTLRSLDYSLPETSSNIRKYMTNFRRVLLDVRSQLATQEEWLDEEAMESIRKHMSDALNCIRNRKP